VLRSIEGMFYLFTILIFFFLKGSKIGILNRTLSRPFSPLVIDPPSSSGLSLLIDWQFLDPVVNSQMEGLLYK